MGEEKIIIIKTDEKFFTFNFYYIIIINNTKMEVKKNGIYHNEF